MANIVQIIIKGIDDTKNGFKAPLDSLENLGKAIKGVRNVAVTALVALESTMAALVAKSIESAAAAGIAAQKAGMSVEAYTKLAYAARFCDVEQEALATGLKKLSKTVGEALADPLSRSAQYFKLLNVQIVDAAGKTKPLEEIVVDLAGAFSRFSDEGVGKVEAAMELFGKTGNDMLPLLNKTKEEIVGLMAETKGVSSETSEQAKDFDDNLKKLRAQIGAVGKGLATELLPTLLRLSEAMLRFSKESGFVEGSVTNLIEFLKYLAVGAYTVWNIFKGLGQILGTIYGLISERVNLAVASAAQLFSLWGQAAIGVASSILNLVKHFGKLGEVIALVKMNKFMDAWEAAKDSFGDDVSKIGKSLEAIFVGTGQIIARAADANYQNTVENGRNLLEDLKRDAENVDRFIATIFSKPKAKPSQSAQIANEPEMPVFGAGRKEAEEQEKLDAKLAEQRANSLRTLGDLMRQMRDENLKGIDAEIAKVDEQFNRRLDQIGQLQLEEEEAISATAEAYRAAEEAKTEILKEQHVLRTEMEAAYNEGRVADYMALMDSAAGQRQIELQQHQEFMSQYAEISKQAHFSVYAFAGQVAGTFYNTLSNAITGLIMGTVKLKDAVKQLGFALLESVVNYIAKWVAAKLTQLALEAVFAATTTSIMSTMAASLAAAWAPAAALASVATFGAAGAAGAAGLVTAFTAAEGIAAMSAVGQAHGGIDSVPREGTWVLSGNERVVQPEANADLTEFLARSNQGPQVVELHVDGEKFGEIIGNLSRDGRLSIHERALVA